MDSQRKAICGAGWKWLLRSLKSLPHIYITLFVFRTHPCNEKPSNAKWMSIKEISRNMSTSTSRPPMVALPVYDMNETLFTKGYFIEMWFVL